MKGYIKNIEKETIENDNFRKVLYTGNYSQLVVMSLEPKQDIGDEIHGLDQFIRIEQGEGMAIFDGVETKIEDNFAIIIPAGTKHNIINTSDKEKMKLYSIYSPPGHKHGTIHQTKEAAEEEHFDGETSE